MSQPTQRTFKQGDREWFVVEGEEGAITFFTYGRGRKPGDLGYHDAADAPILLDEEDEDPRWMRDCEFTQTVGCRYSGTQAQRPLDILREDGPVALFDLLTTVYHNHFGGR